MIPLVGKTAVINGCCRCRNICDNYYTLKRFSSDFFPKKVCRCQKASKRVKLSRKTIKRSTKYKKVFPLDTGEEPSPRKRFRFCGFLYGSFPTVKLI